MATPVLAGRRGVVTGGGSGIGAATAALLMQTGARVLTVSRRRTVGSSEAGVGHETADVRDPGNMERVFRRATGEFGGIDFVIANAGIGDQSDIVDGDPEHWREVLLTNVLGVAHTVRAALPHLRAAGHGDVVIIGSVAGRETYVGEPAYVASKWAVAGLARVIRRESLRSGVRTSLVQPGLVDTPLSHSTPIIEEWLQAVEPLQPADVARAVMFAIAQPWHAAVSEIVLRPLAQEV